jgi:hypothetical protein
MLSNFTGFGKKISGFGKEMDENEDPRYKSTFAKKPWESGKAGFSKYGDFLGFGKSAEEEQDIAIGYKSPFTTLKKEGWQYEGNKLTSQSDRDRMAGKFVTNNDPQVIGGKITQPKSSQPKFGQPRPTPYGSMMDSYKRI